MATKTATRKPRTVKPADNESANALERAIEILNTLAKTSNATHEETVTANDRAEIAANRAANDRAEALAKQAERRATRKAERPAPAPQTAPQTVSGPILDITRQDAMVEITSTRTGKTVHIQIATQSDLATFAPGKRIATHLHEDGSYTGFAWVNSDGMKLFFGQRNSRLYAYLVDMLENPSEHLRRGVKYGVTVTAEV